MFEKITVGELLDRAEQGEFAIIDNGKIVGFETKETAPSETLASSGAVQ